MCQCSTYGNKILFESTNAALLKSVILYVCDYEINLALSMQSVAVVPLRTLKQHKIIYILRWYKNDARKDSGL